MGKERRPELNPEYPEHGPPRLQYDPDTGRVIDYHPDPILEDKLYNGIPMRQLFGPLTHRDIHNPRFGNIFTGLPETKTHHNKETDKARESSHFFGRNATYGYCPVWGYVHGRWMICGREFSIKSGGCSMHGREGMLIYTLQARGEPIPGRLMVDPKIIEAREKEEEEMRRQQARIEQEDDNVKALIKRAAEADVPEWFVQEQIQSSVSQKCKVESEAKQNRRIKTEASLAESLLTEEDEEFQGQVSGTNRRQGSAKTMKTWNQMKKRGGGKKKKR